LRFCVNEAAFLAGASLPPSEPQIWVLRSSDFNKLRLLVSLPKKGKQPQMSSSDRKKLQLEEFVGKSIIIEIFATAGTLKEDQPTEIAPFLNLSASSGRFKQVVEQSEYVLTTEFLLKLFLLHGRQSCSSSLIFSGVCYYMNFSLQTYSSLNKTIFLF
jgi:hypothetical protein